MAIWFKIKGGNLESFTDDEWWFIKKIWYAITLREYERKYMYRLDCDVSDYHLLKVGDLFVTGMEKPPVFFRITEIKGRRITAISANYGNKPMIENLAGLAVVVKSNNKTNKQ